MTAFHLAFRLSKRQNAQVLRNWLKLLSCLQCLTIKGNEKFIQEEYISIYINNLQLHQINKQTPFIESFRENVHIYNIYLFKQQNS